jgi:hypothetical protein
MYFCDGCNITVPGWDCPTERLFGNEEVLLCPECLEPVDEAPEMWPAEMGGEA